jgi:hypothetical protein
MRCCFVLRFVAAVMVTGGAGCGHTGVRAEDQSAVAHRAEASRDTVAARHDASEPDRNIGPRQIALFVAPSDFAAAHERDAAQHTAAADSLDQRVRRECVAVAVTDRSGCPFAGRPVAHIDDVPGGVRMRFAPGGDDAARTALLTRCHAAVLAQQGRETMPSCPLATRALSVQASLDAGSVLLTLTTSDEASVAELRRRARAPGPHGAAVAARLTP